MTDVGPSISSGTAPSNGIAAQLPATELAEPKTSTLAGDDVAAALAVLEGEEPPAAADPDKPAPPPPEQEESAKWAKLTAQERRHKERVAKQTAELNSQKQQIQAEREKFESERKVFAEQQTELRARREAAAKNPLKAMAELGWSLDQLTKYVADNGVVPTEKLLSDMKLQYDDELKRVREEVKQTKEERERERQELTKTQQQHQAQQYEGRVWEGIRQVIGAEGAKYPHLSEVLQNPEAAQATLRNVLNLQVSAMRGEHPDFPGQEKFLAVSDALHYAERQLAGIYAWRNPGQAGAVQSAQPGAAKPSQQEATPVSLTAHSNRTVQRKDPDEMTDAERDELAKRIIAGELD